MFTTAAIELRLHDQAFWENINDKTIPLDDTVQYKKPVAYAERFVNAGEISLKDIRDKSEKHCAPFFDAHVLELCSMVEYLNKQLTEDPLDCWPEKIREEWMDFKVTRWDKFYPKFREIPKPDRLTWHTRDTDLIFVSVLRATTY